MKKRLLALILTVCFVFALPLSCSALTLGDLYEQNNERLYEFLDHFEQRSFDIIKKKFDHAFDTIEDWSDWIDDYGDGFHKIDEGQFDNLSPFSPGSSSGSANFVPSPTESLVFYSNSEKTASQDDLMYIYSCILGVYDCSSNFACYGDYFSTLESPYNFVVLPSYTSDCKLSIIYGNYLFLYGPYSGSVFRFRFAPVESGDFEIDGVHFRQKWRVDRNINRSCSLASGDDLHLDTIPSSSRYFFGTIPMYLDNDCYDPIDLPKNSWAHDFVLHSDGGRWATTDDKYILDLFVYYTGDDPDSVPGNYVSSGGLVYVDESTNSRYLPFSDYIFFDSPGKGKITTMSSPGSVFHMHLDDIKDTLARKQVGFGNWYAFVQVSDLDSKTVYYAQQQLNFDDVDSGMFSGSADYPDWDDYKPTFDDDDTVPPTIVNNYNDYTTLQSPPSSFDFDAYAQWMYTNIGILNDNIGVLNDNIIKFFDAFEDFIDDFYSFFTRKFNMIADHIDDSVDALARYIKDINVTSTYNGNVVVDNMKGELESMFVPDHEDVNVILDVFCPWFGQISDVFDVFADPTPENLATVAGSSGGSSVSDLDSAVFSFPLPAPGDSGSLISWSSYSLDLSTFYNDDLYTALVYIFDAAGFFTCIRLGFSIFGLSILHLDSVAKEDD